MNHENRIILASKSPRRRYLLKQAGIAFSVIPGNCDETAIPLSCPETYVSILAEAKTGEVSDRYPESWIIGADTIVVIDEMILGKPASLSEARSMLRQLSGRTHQVLTGYCICCKAKQKKITDAVKTDVLFKSLSDGEIEWYIQTSEPFDKAGGYGIQGVGAFLVKSIHGSYTNVVGLPLCEVIECLVREGVLAFNTPVEFK